MNFHTSADNKFMTARKSHRSIRYRKSHSTIKFVRQRWSDGCSIAAGAMIAGISYDKAHKLFVNCNPSHLASLEDLKKGFKKIGVSCKMSYGDAKLLTRNVRAVFVFDWDGCSSATHCVIYDKGRFIDPGGSAYSHNPCEYEYQWSQQDSQAALIIL